MNPKYFKFFINWKIFIVFIEGNGKNKIIKSKLMVILNMYFFTFIKSLSRLLNLSTQ